MHFFVFCHFVKSGQDISSRKKYDTKILLSVAIIQKLPFLFSVLGPNAIGVTMQQWLRAFLPHCHSEREKKNVTG